jgi:hypothetical protein
MLSCLFFSFLFFLCKTSKYHLTPKKKKKLLLKKTILLEEPKDISYTHASTRPGRAATGPIRPDPTRAGAPRLQSLCFPASLAVCAAIPLPRSSQRPGPLSALYNSWLKPGDVSGTGLIEISF